MLIPIVQGVLSHLTTMLVGRRAVDMSLDHVVSHLAPGLGAVKNLPLVDFRGTDNIFSRDLR